MKELYGKTPEGLDVYLYTLENKNGMCVKITNLGGTVCSILFPDKNGKIEDLILGYNNLEDIITKENPYFGSLIGRYANRIAKGSFSIDDKTYKLATNNGPNHLHGGIKGFDKVVWEAKEINGNDFVELELNYFSKDGEEGYPGNLKVKVIYSLTNDNEFRISYEATTDKTTHINLTNHCYFNLCGNAKRNVLDHEVKIMANDYTPVDKNLIPTGEIKTVVGTPFNFSDFKRIGEDINKVPGGYDHNFVTNSTKAFVDKIAEVRENESGRIMEVSTSEPGVQFYTANFLSSEIVGKESTPYDKHYAFCLETQHFPDSPNHPQFPSTLLKPGDTYKQLTVYKFLTIEKE